MKDDWDIIKLKNILNIQNGYAFNSKEFDYEKGVQLIRIRDLKDGYNTVVKFLGVYDEKYIVKKGDFLIGMDGEFECYEWKGENSLLNQRVCRLEGFDDKLLPKYLFYGINKYLKDIEEVTSYTTVKHISSRQINDIDFPIPPLEEQKQIVAILDKAFAAIDQAKANIEKNIENAKELFQSKLNDIFSQKGDGWEEKTLGELGKVSMCKRILKKQTTPDGEIPFFKIGTFGKEPNAFISKEIYDEFRSKYSFPKKGDILLSASGTIGRRVIYDGEPAYFQDSNIVWIDNNEELVTNEYLYQFYGVCDFNPSKGATISRLYNDDLRKIKISFPSIEEQKVVIPKMIELSNQTLKIKSNYKKKLEDLEELKKSILQKAFAGELTQNQLTTI